MLPLKMKKKKKTIQNIVIVLEIARPFHALQLSIQNFLVCPMVFQLID